MVDEPKSPVEPELSCVLVNYRTAAQTIECVQSLLQTQICDIENVVVVDNGSWDDSVQKIKSALPGALVMAFDRNRGFASAVNIGVQATRSRYVLVLNPDTYFLTNTVAPVIQAMERDRSYAMIGLDLIYPNGARQYSARRFYSVVDILGRRLPRPGARLSARIGRHLMKEIYTSSGPCEVDWVIGTGFVVRRSTFDLIGRMDENYFLYFEDVDLCARVWKSGFKVGLYRGAFLVHEYRRSSASSPLSMAGLRHLRGLLRFTRKFGLPLFDHRPIHGMRVPGGAVEAGEGPSVQAS